MTDLSERELITRCRTGDEAAFRELVERHKNLVYALIARSIPDRSRTDDLAHEVFLRVHRGLPYFRGDARLSTWIYRIVANLCSQERPVREVIPIAPDGTIDPSMGRTGAVLGTADPAFGDLELRDRLEKALARLPPQQRLLIAGHYLKGVRYEDLADALGIPLGTVKTHLHRAKRALRQLLETDLR